jgi:hypothetical protein
MSAPSRRSYTIANLARLPERLDFTLISKLAAHQLRLPDVYSNRAATRVNILNTWEKRQGSGYELPRIPLLGGSVNSRMA